MQRRHLLALGGSALGSALLPAPALAQPAWPQRQPIRFISPFPPGGFADTLARLVAPEIGSAVGQTVVVENRVGGGGTIGLDTAAKSAPDGYTLVLSHASPNGVAPGTQPSLPYHVVDDFTHLALLAESGNILMVKGDGPLRSLADFIAAGRGAGGVRFGSSGMGSLTHLIGEFFGREANIPRLDHIPYRGSAQGLQDLMGGRIESVFDPITTNVQLLRSGQVRSLGITTASRIAAFPEMPTFAELGFPQVTATVWAGLSAPRGLPPEIAARLTDAALAAMRNPSVRGRVEELATYAPAQPVTGTAYAAFIREFSTKWSGVARAANIQAG
ncbi:MAG: tripartite tricarboxylate transporter substrate binding protein [Acetobacteraceae bacterium]|nr:tripartite tricarboxylate transporter substrate binding protein [Acetobacteraceae bacterium]